MTRSTLRLIVNKVLDQGTVPEESVTRLILHERKGKGDGNA